MDLEMDLEMDGRTYSCFILMKWEWDSASADTTLGMYSINLSTFTETKE